MSEFSPGYLEKIEKLGGAGHPHKHYLYRWANKIDSEGLPIVEETLFFNMPRNYHKLYTSYGGMAVKSNGSKFQTCAITGMDCYTVDEQTLLALKKRTCVRSKEHLLSRKLYGVGVLDTSIVPAGYSINRSIGHMPASLKLYIRRYLGSKQYDRNDYLDVKQTYGTILKHKIDVENSFRLHGLYPWQPWTYSVVEHRAAAEDFLKRLMQMDEEFFQNITMQNRYDHFDHSLLPIEVL